MLFFLLGIIFIYSYICLSIDNEKIIYIYKNNNSMTYRSQEIASFFLSKYNPKKYDITPMKLIKLVYIAHGWYLGMKGETLIDENPEAWKYGPVISSLYRRYKSFGNNVITVSEDEKKLCSNISEEDSKFLERIFEVYGGFSGIELSAKTHKYDTPWSKVWNDIKDKDYMFSVQIPENDIKEYYKKMYIINKSSKSKH